MSISEGHSDEPSDVLEAKIPEVCDEIGTKDGLLDISDDAIFEFEVERESVLIQDQTYGRLAAVSARVW